MNVVNVAVSIDISMCGMVWGEWEAAEGTTLIEVEYINALREERRGGEGEGERRGGGEEGRKGGGEPPPPLSLQVCAHFSSTDAF